MKILLASPIDPAAIARLREAHDVIDISNSGGDRLATAISDREVLVFRSGLSITREILGLAPDLRLLVRAGSGLDNIDLDYVEQNGLVLERIPGPGARAVAELAFALMLNLARRIRTADTLLRDGRWAKHQLSGYLLHGKTLGVYGCGNIGRQVARIGQAFGMRVIACTRDDDQQRRQTLEEESIRVLASGQVLEQADFLSIHVPLNSETQHLFDQQALDAMKPGAFLVNLARGGVVDEEALYAALSSGRLSGAGVDVHEREGEGQVSRLASLPNVILTPHIGSGTVDTQRQIGERVIELVERLSERRVENNESQRPFAVATVPQ